MSNLSIAALFALAAVLNASLASAQDLRGFLGAGAVGETNDQHYPAVGAGVLVDLGQPWISAGGQGDMFFSWPYVAGRGGMFLQGNLLPKGPVRPFVLAGFGSGEADGAMLGAGVEFRPTTRAAGFRVSVEDYRAKVGGPTEYHTGHQLTIRAALTFR
jgi:hypothetical protein